MNIGCPACGKVYRIDPERVPGSGARTRCAECGAPFFAFAEPEGQRPGVTVIGRPAPEPGQAAPARPAAPEPDPGPGARSREPRPAEPASPSAPVFGPQDPQTRARRLARALISDIKVYNRDRWEESRSAGTLRKDFRDEVLKSWEEYVEQVGEPMAKQTPYFRDALNDILAAGERVF